MLPRTWRQRSSLTKSMDTEDLARLGMQLAKGYYYSSVDPMLDKLNLDYLTLTQFELCGSRKYPYPPPTEDNWKFRGVGGFRGKLLFQRVTNHVTNIESNIRSI